MLLGSLVLARRLYSGMRGLDIALGKRRAEVEAASPENWEMKKSRIPGDMGKGSIGGNGMKGPFVNEERRKWG